VKALERERARIVRIEQALGSSFASYDRVR
jgi:hypothetical protein